MYTSNIMSEYRPIYTLFENRIMPFANINLKELYNAFETMIVMLMFAFVSITKVALNITTIIMSHLVTLSYTGLQQLYISATSGLENNYEFAFIILTAIGFIALTFYDKFLNVTVYQPALLSKINSLELEIATLKKKERMTNSDLDTIMRTIGQKEKENKPSDLSDFKKEITQKFKDVDKQLKKMEKEVKRYN